MFKKWKEKVRSELKSDIDDWKNAAIQVYQEEILKIAARFSAFEKSISADCDSAIDHINREKKSWDDFIQKREDWEIKRNQEVAVNNARHIREIERGLKMCEESLEIIKKLLEERK